MITLLTVVYIEERQSILSRYVVSICELVAYRQSTSPPNGLVHRQSS